MHKLLKIFSLTFLLFSAQATLAQDQPYEVSSAQCDERGGRCQRTDAECESGETQVGICTTGIDSACCKFNSPEPPIDGINFSDLSNADCARAGGVCNSYYSACESNQSKIGVCTSGVNAACCKFKENGSVNEENPGAIANADEDPLPIVRGCERSKDDGGWGGVCKTSSTGGTDGCDNGGDSNESGTEDFVGACDNELTSACCVQSGTALQNPTSQNYRSIFVDSSFCSNSFSKNGEGKIQGMGGSCNDIDAQILGGLAGSDPTCPDPNTVFAGLCGTFETQNGCCVPKDGAYCNHLASVGQDCEGIGVATTLSYGDYTLLERIPGYNSDSGDLAGYLKALYYAGLVIVALGAVFMIAVGGFIYMASAGNTTAIKKGKGMITDALIGLVIALAAWFILNIINPDLVNLKIDPLRSLSFETNVSINEDGGAGGSASGAGGGGSCTAIPDSQLKAFPSEAADRANRRDTTDTVDRFMAMRAAAALDRVNLRAGNAYRSPQEQEDIWRSHGCRISEGRTVCTGALAAVPCSIDSSKGSNHTKGTAIDIQTNAAGTTWLRANAARFGFYNNIPSEPWHWSDTGL